REVIRAVRDRALDLVGLVLGQLAVFDELLKLIKARLLEVALEGGFADAQPRCELLQEVFHGRIKLARRGRGRGTGGIRTQAVLKDAEDGLAVPLGRRGWRMARPRRTAE